MERGEIPGRATLDRARRYGKFNQYIHRATGSMDDRNPSHGKTLERSAIASRDTSNITFTRGRDRPHIAVPSDGQPIRVLP